MEIYTQYSSMQFLAAMYEASTTSTLVFLTEPLVCLFPMIQKKFDNAKRQELQ